ncbi:MAG: SET domain-containing protein [Candidatus Nanoarchaeia archaeon]
MKLIIKKSKIEGKGIFAHKSIKKYEKVFKFADRVIKINHKHGCHCKICKRCIQIDKFNWLYPNQESYGWYLNHNCNPSCGIKGKYIVALKNIRPKEEISIDYSTTNNDEVWEMKCYCNNSKCRNKIKSIQFLPKNLYKKYKGFIPKYVEKSYKI